MADIADMMTVVRWLEAEASPYVDFPVEFLYAKMLRRGITEDDTLVSEVTEKQLDLLLADVYVGAALSSSKSGTQGEADGGWSHYVAIKNVVSRDALLRMAKDLYDRWGEPFSDPTPKIVLKDLYGDV